MVFTLGSQVRIVTILSQQGLLVTLGALNFGCDFKFWVVSNGLRFARVNGQVLTWSFVPQGSPCSFDRSDSWTASLNLVSKVRILVQNLCPLLWRPSVLNHYNLILAFLTVDPSRLCNPRKSRTLAIKRSLLFRCLLIRQIAAQ